MNWRRSPQLSAPAQLSRRRYFFFFRLNTLQSRVDSREPHGPVERILLQSTLVNMLKRRFFCLSLAVSPRSSPCLSGLSPRRMMTSTPYHAVRPREFPSSGFVEIRLAQKIEEESLPSYNRNEYYPMRIGDVVRGRYQVVAKLGYGSSSTVWLARDLT